MSKYNTFARRLEDTFMEARRAYNEAADKVAEAEQAKAKAEAQHTETYVGECAARRARAEARLIEEKGKFDKAKKEIWAQYDRAVEALTRELSEAVRADNVADPDAIDNNALVLLQSGVMSVDDYEHFLSRFDGNSAMLKLVGKYASEAAEREKDDVSARTRLASVAFAAKDGQGATMRNWNGIVSSARIMTGQSHGNAATSYVQSMTSRWEDVMGDAIRGF